MMQDRWPGLASEERSIVESVARFSERELVSRAARTDSEATFVHEQLRGLSGLGALGANLPEEAGGPGLSALALFAIVETIAFRVLVGAMGVCLLVTILLGLWLAWKQSGRKHWALLAIGLGVVIPIAILWLA